MYVFLFTDIEGSTRLWEEHTAAMTGVIARHDEILRQVVDGQGGRITKHTGDGITAAFEGGRPLGCALEAQVRFAAEPWQTIGTLPIRVGLHAGDAEFHASAGTPDGDYFGPPVNATARVMSADGEPSPAVKPLPIPTRRPILMASLGDNRGELARYEYDVWTYDGQAGEVLTLHMKADNPISPKMDCLPCGIPAMAYEEKYPAGILDPFLTVTAPDGSLLARADDAPSREDWESGDSLIEAVYLPSAGPYRIEASSLLDDLAGGYTLTIESRRVDIDPAVLQSYAGRYEAPWGEVVTVSFQDGRLYSLCCPEWPGKHRLDPISENEFVENPDGNRVVFYLADDGLADRFVVINPYGRFEHVRLEE